MRPQSKRNGRIELWCPFSVGKPLEERCNTLSRTTSLPQQRWTMCPPPPPGKFFSHAPRHTTGGYACQLSVEFHRMVLYCCCFLFRHSVKFKMSSWETAWIKEWRIQYRKGSHICNAMCPGLNQQISVHYLLYLPSAQAPGECHRRRHWVESGRCKTLHSLLSALKYHGQIVLQRALNLATLITRPDPASTRAKPSDQPVCSCHQLPVPRNLQCHQFETVVSKGQLGPNIQSWAGWG